MRIYSSGLKSSARAPIYIYIRAVLPPLLPLLSGSPRIHHPVDSALNGRFDLGRVPFASRRESRLSVPSESLAFFFRVKNTSFSSAAKSRASCSKVDGQGGTRTYLFFGVSKRRLLLIDVFHRADESREGGREGDRSLYFATKGSGQVAQDG